MVERQKSVARANKPTNSGKPASKPAKKAESTVIDDPVEDVVIVTEHASTATPEAAKKPEPAVRARNSAIPLVLGGVVAGAVGFAAALVVTGDVGPFRVDTTATDNLAAQNLTLNNEIAALKSQIANLELAIAGGPTNAAVNGLGTRQDRADTLATDQADTLAALDGRVTDIENRPIPEGGTTADAVATYERELAAMRQMFAEELKRIEAAQAASASAQANAAIQSNSVTRQVTFAAIQRALNSGDSFAAELAELGDAGVVAPDDLVSAAQGGVVTLAALQDQFPDVARAALDASIRAQADAGTTNRITAFFRTQLGARSLEPQDGDDPDAILSRAEAALRNGDIDTSINEIAALPAIGAAQMADWVALALSRQMAVKALADLSAEMGL